jgi:hypothetical protein
MWLGFQLTCSYLQCLPRHKGIGSLPSAITTACSARIAELPCRGLLIGIALYSPASATTVSRPSTTLFIGGVSFAHTSARGEVYARIEASWATRPVDNCRFLRARGVLPHSFGRNGSVNHSRSLPGSVRGWRQIAIALIDQRSKRVMADFDSRG